MQGGLEALTLVFIAPQMTNFMTAQGIAKPQCVNTYILTPSKCTNVSKSLKKNVLPNTCPFHIFQCQRKRLLYPNFRNIHEDAICLRQNRKLKPLVIALGLYIWEYHQISNTSAP